MATTLMNTPTERETVAVNSPIASAGNWTKAFAFLILFAAAGSIFVSQSLASGRVRNVSTKLLISVAEKKGEEQADMPSPADLRAAVAAEPYSQDMVNAAVVARYFRDHDKARLVRGMRQVDRLGWRSTTALQNRIQLAMAERDLSGVVDVADALLRRDKIVEQATVLMNYMELMPETQELLAAKIVARPSWRSAYLANVASLKTPQQIKARGTMINDILARGDRLTRDELSPNLLAMVTAGSARPAYALWRKFEKRPATLLNDPKFELAAKNGVSPYFLIPFEWQFGAANGYWSEVFEDNGQTLLRINWNGKYVPELMKQQTVLDPGAYRLVVTGRDMDAPAAAQLDFALVCAQGRFPFDKLVSRSSSRLELALRAASACLNPQFVVAGQPAAAAPAARGVISFGMTNEVSITLQSIELTYLGASLAGPLPSAATSKGSQ